MRHPLWRFCSGLVGLMFSFGVAVLAQSIPKPAVPLEPISAILDAFKTHEIVALADAHGNDQNHAFRLALIRDPRFALTVNDIVIELGNARYQSVADEFARGGNVGPEDLRHIWRDTTVPTAGNNYLMIEELLRTVREVNTTLPRERQLRVLLGDPPIDWARVHTHDEHTQWIAMRDSYPAARIEVEVLAKSRRALVLYGQRHFQRQNIDSNFDMEHWQAQTIVSLLEAATPTKVFTIWQEDSLSNLQPDIGSWPVPSLAITRGTVLGAADVTVYTPAPSRVSVIDGKVVPVPRDRFKSLRAEDQFDAALYLGPVQTLTNHPSYEIPPALCSEPGFVEMQLNRISIAAVPKFEADQLKQYCSAVSTK